MSDGLTFSPRLLKSKSALIRADYFMILRDLDHAVSCCDWLLQKQEWLGTSLESRAMIDSLVIRYRRCFKKGARFSLSIKNLDDVSEADLETHQKFIDYSDKHVAHSVNGCELFGTVIQIAVDKDKKVHRGGLGGTGRFADEISLQDIEKFKLIILKVKNYVLKQSSHLATILEKEIEAMTDEQLTSLPEGFTPFEKKIDFKKRRKWPK